MRQIFPFEEPPTLFDDMVTITELIADGLVDYADQALADVHLQHYGTLSTWGEELGVHSPPWFEITQAFLQDRDADRFRHGDVQYGGPAAGADDPDFHVGWHIPEGTGPLWGRLPDGEIMKEEEWTDAGQWVWDHTPVPWESRMQRIPMYGIRPHIDRQLTPEQICLIESLSYAEPEMIQKMVAEADLDEPPSAAMYDPEDPNA